jgi:hypothetical protein
VYKCSPQTKKKASSLPLPTSLSTQTKKKYNPGYHHNAERYEQQKTGMKNNAGLYIKKYWDDTLSQA